MALLNDILFGGQQAQPRPLGNSSNTPAAIRYNNPGAMYPGDVSRRFGSTGHEVIGGGHQIAVFPDPVSGAAAQFALLGQNYSGMTLADAVTKWSGGNNSPDYINAVAQRTGLDPNARLTPELLRDPNVAIPLARGMAGWEAGRDSPLNDDQWRTAHSWGMGGERPEALPNAPPGGNTQQAVAPPVQVPDSSNLPAPPAKGPIGQAVSAFVRSAAGDMFGSLSGGSGGGTPAGGNTGSDFIGNLFGGGNQQQAKGGIPPADAARAAAANLTAGEEGVQIGAPQIKPLDMERLRMVMQQRGMLGT